MHGLNSNQRSTLENNRIGPFASGRLASVIRRTLLFSVLSSPCQEPDSEHGSIRVQVEEGKVIVDRTQLPSGHSFFSEVTRSQGRLPRRASVRSLACQCCGKTKCLHGCGDICF